MLLSHSISTLFHLYRPRICCVNAIQSHIVSFLLHLCSLRLAEASIGQTLWKTGQKKLYSILYHIHSYSILFSDISSTRFFSIPSWFPVLPFSSHLPPRFGVCACRIGRVASASARTQAHWRHGGICHRFRWDFRKIMGKHSGRLW